MAVDEDQTTTEVGDGGGHGGNYNKSCPLPPATVPDEDLDDDFQGAMHALQRERDSEHGQPTVVETYGNQALIWLGEYELHAYSERWDDPTAELYILVDQSFDGSDPHWMMMTPAVTVDDQDAGVIQCRNTFTKPSDSHYDKVEKVLEVADEESAIAFSWRWSKMNRQPEQMRDLADAHSIVQYLLRLDGAEGAA
ncbi:hypothetical protein [Halopiger xanaduensis]|uniref:Uncharacterized protein n=1 Tax=Halopiger xanaduensis (strain DSM 18323 / JCM 14033 / SH-6) TaxID=797210 RepID=F8DEJ8_HALXS|nr:hypothetical protein [Halopiger xanaduensis]AEH39285.1 hypothetical protein Halxa_0032 [Halopiger xanaduensis SH-6]